MPLAMIFCRTPISLGRGIFYAKGFYHRNPGTKINGISFRCKSFKRNFN